MSQPVDDDDRPDRRSRGERRGFFRGGRRATDWPPSLTAPIRCPRCASPEAKFVEATPETLFWECHRCRHPWSTDPQGTLLA